MTDTLHARLIAVRTALNATGIGKTARNKEQGYNFRSVDGVLDAVGPAMTRAGIVTTLAFDEWSVDNGTVTTKSGPRSITRAMCKCTIRFSTENGEVLETQGLGEASDYADKSTNKAMSNAWKYAMCLALQIPFVGTGDEPEAHSPGAADMTETIEQAKTMARTHGLGAVAEWAKALDDAGKTALRASWAEIKAVAKPEMSERDKDYEGVCTAIETGVGATEVAALIGEYSAKHDDKEGVNVLIAKAKERDAK